MTTSLDTSRVDEIAANLTKYVPLDVQSFNVAKNVFQSSGSQTRREPETDRKLHPFEAYVIGYSSNLQTTAYVQVFKGTVIDSEDDCTATAISNMDDTFSVVDGTIGYIEADFLDDGTIVSLTLKNDSPWSGYPALYETYTGGNKWYHPIYQARTCNRGKRPETPTPSPLAPNPGEFPEILPDIKIVQKTNTHLMKAQICAGAAKTLIWALLPGPGGID